MTTTTFNTGLTIGWEWAGVYATGTKAERREIRRKLSRMAASDNAIVRGIWEGFEDRASQRAEAIRAGLAPHTIRPGKLESVLERI